MTPRITMEDWEAWVQGKRIEFYLGMTGHTVLEFTSAQADEMAAMLKKLAQQARMQQRVKKAMEK